LSEVSAVGDAIDDIVVFVTAFHALVFHVNEGGSGEGTEVFGGDVTAETLGNSFHGEKLAGFPGISVFTAALAEDGCNAI
jgi:hypothetical protein